MVGTFLLLTNNINVVNIAEKKYYQNMDVGRRFRRFRLKAGLTQKDAAILIGVNYYQLGNYETNRSEPSITILKAMSRAYKVSVDELIGNKLMDKNLEINKLREGYIDVDELRERLNEMLDEYNSKEGQK